MQEVILYIQPQLRTGTTQDFVRADLIEPELITLTQVIQDVKEIDKIFTDYSRTFNLPASKKNNILFKRWYNPDIVGFDNQIMANARIELNHLPFKEGKIRLESVTMKHNKPSLYKVTFFGSTVAITELFGDDELSSLDWLDNFNHTYNTTNVKAGLDTGLDFTVDSVSYTDAIIYPLITHSQRLIADSVNNLDNGGNITVNTTNRTRRGVVPEDLKPAITVKLILKAIEQKYGITFKTGEFFDSAAMTNMYLWLHRNKGKIITSGVWESYSDSYNCTSATAIECTYATDSTSVAAQSLGFFKVAEGILFWKRFIPDTFQFALEDTTLYVLEITPTSGFVNALYDLELTVNGGDSLISASSLQGTNLIALRIGGTSGLDINTLCAEYGNSFNVVGRLSSLEPIQFQAKFTLDRKVDILDFNTGVTTVYDYTAELTSASSTLQPTDSVLQITRRIPKIKVLDFLKGLFKMHNLTAFLNMHNQIVVKTLDSFYSGGDTLDLTEYVKTDERTVGKTEPFSEIDLEYKEPQTILAQEFLNTNNRRFGKAEFISDLKSSEKYEVEAPFEHMLYERLPRLGAGALSSSQITDIQYGLHTDENEEPTVGAPLIFYGIYKSVSYGLNFVDGSRPETKNALLPEGDTPNTRYSLSNFWMPHNANALGIPITTTTKSPPPHNLNFGSEINSYDLTDFGGINNSLFQLYYQNYITRVFNKRTRLFNYKAILPLNILLKLSLDDTIIVQERAFTINKMTTKLQSGETEFELLNEPT